MSIEKARDHLKKFDLDKKILEFESSSATVLLAAQVLGCEPKRIAKSLSFEKGEAAVLIVTAGDTKIDNQKFKKQFGMKAKLLSAEKVKACTGHDIGGVCPFGVPESTEVYCDLSMKRFETLFPACGSSNSAIELDCDSLFKVAKARAWIDVCKDWK